MNGTVVTAHVRALLGALVYFSLLIAANTASAQEEKGAHGMQQQPSPTTAVGPAWKGATRKHWDLRLQQLPDLVSYAETTDDFCTVKLWLRNNGLSGLTEEQWSSADDSVRLEVWDVLTARLVEQLDWRLNEIDLLRNLTRRGGETFPRIEWDLEEEYGRGVWYVKLSVDSAGAIPELSEENNMAVAYLHCRPGD
jgi:hypothetical protein